MVLDTRYDNVAVPDFLIFLIFLGDDYDSTGSLKGRSSVCDSLPLYLGHFPTLYIKMICLKNIL